jgi:hypothetical protein
VPATTAEGQGAEDASMRAEQGAQVAQEEELLELLAGRTLPELRLRAEAAGASPALLNSVKDGEASEEELEEAAEELLALIVAFESWTILLVRGEPYKAVHIVLLAHVRADLLRRELDAVGVDPRRQIRFEVPRKLGGALRVAERGVSERFEQKLLPSVDQDPEPRPIVRRRNGALDDCKPLRVKMALDLRTPPNHCATGDTSSTENAMSVPGAQDIRA